MYTLLLADDETLERDALRLFIEDSRLEIERILECRTGSETLKTILLEKPDIAILDINMPGMNGLEVLEKLRVAHPQCQVIFSTAYDYFEYAVQALKLGALDFLVKPVKQEVLIAAINRAVDELDAEAERVGQSARMQELIAVMSPRIAQELCLGSLSAEALFFFELAAIDCAAGGRLLLIQTEADCADDALLAAIEDARETLALAGIRVLSHREKRRVLLIAFDGARLQVRERMDGMVAEALKRAACPLGIAASADFRELGDIAAFFAGQSPVEPEVEDGADTAGRGAELVSRVKLYIDSHLDRRIGLDDIAEAGAYSKYYLCHTFKRLTGQTIVDYLVARRMDRAKELLADGSLSIKQISSMVGYADPNYFTLSFSRFVGQSPVKFRYAKTGARSARL